MYYTGCILPLFLLGSSLTYADKIVPNKSDGDSYENGVGTSYTVALNPPSSAQVSKNSRKYSVSGDDLERADLQAAASASYRSPVYGGTVDSYSAPVNNLDKLAGTSGQQTEAQDRDGASGHHHHHHNEHSAPAPAAASPSASSQVTSWRLTISFISSHSIFEIK